MRAIVTDGQLGQLAVKQHELFERGKRGVYASFEEMLDALQLVIEGKVPVPPMLVVEPVYTITRGDGRSAEQLLAAGAYGKVWEYAEKFVKSADFSVSNVRENADFEMVEFDHDPGTDEVLAEFVKRSLERPLPEDALRFGEKYPDVQKKNPIIFLHEPWRAPDGHLRVLYLDDWGGKRYLSTSLFEHRWLRRCRFPARRPRK